MFEMPTFPRMTFLLLCILGMTLVTSGFPQSRLRLRSPDDSEEPTPDDWDVLFPSISLRDWSVQMMSSPSLGAAANSKAGLMRGAWLFAPQRPEARTIDFIPNISFNGPVELDEKTAIALMVNLAQRLETAQGYSTTSFVQSVERAWPAEWPSQGAGVVKRNMVVADDSAFREKSKLLTSMERQKWLNAYMQKLLVVNS